MITFRCVSRIVKLPREDFYWTEQENNDFDRSLQGYEMTRDLGDSRVHRALEYIETNRALRGYQMGKILNDYQLVRYAVEYLGHHARLSEQLLMSARESSHRPTATSVQPFSPYAKASLSQETCQQLYHLVNESETRELLVRLLLYDGQYFSNCRMTAKFEEATAIHITVLLGLYSATVCLLDANTNCSIDDKDFNDEPALMVAVRKDFSHLVTLLVQRGANVDLRTNPGREVLLYAAEKGLTTTANQIIARARTLACGQGLRRRLGIGFTRSDDQTVSLLCSAYHGDGTTILRLLKDSKSTKFARGNGVLGSCLLLATQKRYHGVVKLLIANGVDINSRDVSGRTALHRAVERNDKVLVEMLLEQNADIDIKDNNSMTAWSSICGFTEYAEVEAILARAKSDTNPKGMNGVSALYTAAALGHTDIVRRLLEIGTDPNRATKSGWFPLVSII